MVHDISWPFVFLGCISVNLGVWTGRYFFSNPRRHLDFSTIWYLSLGYLIDASTFKWGW